MQGGQAVKKAVCLLDSAVSTAIAKSQGYEIHALTFDYGQRHKKEIECAKKLGEFYDVSEHKILKIALDEIGGSALTDDIEIPAGKNAAEIKNSQGIPQTYVPARNTIMLSFALAYAETIGAVAIFIGANYIDYSGYPDCRPRYFQRFQEMANLATRAGVEGGKIGIETPVIEMTKAEIIKKGFDLNVPFKYTWSCYRGGEKACGKCDSCVLRLEGFEKAGYGDPIEYE
jgi:7-cyano-7-deazaguanine synthase